MGSLMGSVTTPSTIPLPEAWVEKMFHKMLLDYGKKFTDQWGGADTDDLIKHWANELSGYTGAEIKRGLAAMESRDWPATLPEFKKMCRPPADPLVAYYEAVAGVRARAAGEMGAWSHPAIYWAAMPLSFDLGAQTYSQIKVRWERALDEQLDRGEWEPIPRPMLALAAPGKTQMSRADAAKRIRELNATAVIKKAADGIDHKRWAKNILERLARGDKTLLLIQIKDAKMAMGIEDEATA